MDFFLRYGNLLKADGTNQLQRTLPALERGYVLPDERSLPDLVEYARRLSMEVRFYSLSGQATGDWRAFLEPLVDPDPVTGLAPDTEALEARIAARSDWPPHVVLFIVFLKLFRHLQDDLNELPQRHLAHYYENQLQLIRRDAVADDVHVIFELARNAAPTLLPAGTALDAGKDGKGRALTYLTRSELVVSAAQVTEKRRLVAETDLRGHKRFFVSDSVSEAEGDSWHTFGRRQLDLDASQRFMTEAGIGFAVAAPLLRLAEGQRTVTLVAHLRKETGALPPEQGIGFSLIAELTGEEGWLKPDQFNARLVDNDSDPMTLEIELVLDAAAPGVVDFDAALHGGGPVSEWPVLRCLLRGVDGRYETLEGLIVDRLELAVAVTGVQKLVVQNDQGPLAPDQPMQLFGSQPRVGSHFYVGSAEVFAKKLSSLTLHLEWQDAPENLLSHYREYFDFVDTGLSASFRGLFVAELELLHDRTWDHPLGSHTLFGAGQTASHALDVAGSGFDSAFGTRPYGARPDLERLERFDPASRNGFVRLALSGPRQEDLHSNLGVDYASEVPYQAFGHQAFSRRYAAQAIALSRWEESLGTDEPKLPNEPYTPTLASLTLDYTSSAEIVPGGPGDEAWITVGPWGYAVADASGEGEAAARLVPAIDGDANLFVGVDQLTPPANLSLLFQIDTGTAVEGEVLKPGDTEWSYLSGASWRTLPRSAVLNDGTYGFQQPGLVVLSVGRQASTEHTVMPAGPVWLRAVIRRPPGSAARTRALSAQGARATFEPTGKLADDQDHLAAGLAAGTVTRLSKRTAAIKKVSQPHASFDGRGPELDAAYFRRCSERLRHRARAVTAWDFERLVLEAFPEVFKVKCLPHSDAGGNARPGEAALVVLPDLRSTEIANPLEPRAGAVLMGRIADFLATSLASPFAALHVIHPVYERIRVDARVAFQPGLDAGYHANLLDEHLQHFLSPWAFEEGQDIVFGARIYKSEILAFMEGREYVDYVTDFELYHSFTGPPRGGIGLMEIGRDFQIRPDPVPAVAAMRIGTDFVVGRGVEVAETSLPHAVLVSHAEHRLTPVDPGEDLCVGASVLGIGFMTVGFDFEVSSS